MRPTELRRETGTIAQLHAPGFVQGHQCARSLPGRPIGENGGDLARSRIMRAAEWDVEFGADETTPEGLVS
jgi:hypothetical protein